MVTNPFQPPYDEGSVARCDERSTAVKLAYFIVAIPTIYIAGTLLFVLSNALLNGFGLGVDFQNAFTQFFVGAGISATMIGIPAYAAWALLSRELSGRNRINWASLICLGNMVVMPWFLYAKYFRLADSVLATKRDRANADG